MLRRLQPIQVVALAAMAVILVGLTVAWANVLRPPGHNVMAHRSAAAPDVLTVAFPSNGLRAGDRIVAVDGVPTTDPAFDARFWRPQPMGDLLNLRVQRAGSGSVADVAIVVSPPVASTAFFALCLITTLWALVNLAVPLFLVLVRPRERVVRPLLFAGFVAALSIPPAFLANQPSDQWHLGIRFAFLLPTLAMIGTVHAFLVFPTPHPVARLLDRRGGIALLYLIPATIAVALEFGPVERLGSSLLVFTGCSLVANLLLLRSYWRQETPLVRPQLRWILLGYAVSGVATGAIAASTMLVGHGDEVGRAAVYAAGMVHPFGIALAVLRYRLFDVGRVVRAAVNYALFTALLVAGFAALVVLGSRLVSSLLGPEAVADSTVPVLAAVAMALLATPLRQRIQASLEWSVYRADVRRRRFVREANEVLGRAQPLDVVVQQLTEHTQRQLDLDLALLALPGTLAPPPMGLRVEPLLERLAAASGPVVLSEEDLRASGVAVAPLDDPALAPWYAAGVRVLVPLRAADAAGGLAGVWALGSQRSGDLPERADLAALDEVGQRAAILLDYARLNDEQLRQALVRQDLARAREIQQRMQPPPFAGWPGQLDVAARLQSAREASGDFYDLFELSGAGVGRAPVQIAVGDVQGKGIGAALVMAVAASALRTAAELGGDRGSGGRSPAATLSVVGGLLNRTLGARDFVCCAVAIIETTENGAPHLRLANAGQVPPLLCRDGDAAELRPDGEALPLGVLAAPAYRDRSVELQPGDAVLFVSDGVPEAPASADWKVDDANGRSDLTPPMAPGEFFGFDRLAKAATYWSARTASAADLVDALWSDLAAWSGQELQHDDTAMVVVRVPVEKRRG